MDARLVGHGLTSQGSEIHLDEEGCQLRKGPEKTKNLVPYIFSPGVGPVIKVSFITNMCIRTSNSLPRHHVENQLGHSLPHISMHEGGIFDGGERRSLDKDEILVYPLDECARYLLV